MRIESDRAFRPFFDTPVSLRGDRREGGRVRRVEAAATACVVWDGQAEAPENAAAPSPARAVTVVIRRAEWNDHLPPRAGDAVILPGGSRLVVRAVDPGGLHIALQAEEACRA